MPNKKYKEVNDTEILLLDANKILDGIVTNSLVMTLHNKVLKVLLCRFIGYDKWMLPGGFVFGSEEIDAAAKRALRTKIGVEDFRLHQFHIFGESGRESFDELRDYLRFNNVPESKIPEHWIFHRHISAAYYTFIQYSDIKTLYTSTEEVKWFDIYDLPENLYADHREIIETGLETVKKHINNILLTA